MSSKKKLTPSITTMFKPDTPKSSGRPDYGPTSPGTKAQKMGTRTLGGGVKILKTPDSYAASNREPLLSNVSTPSSARNRDASPDSPGHLARRILKGAKPKSHKEGFSGEQDAQQLFQKEKVLQARFWRILVVTALLSSSLSFGIDEITMIMGTWRTQFTNLTSGYNLALITIFNCCCCILARLIVRQSVEAEGSGFPEMKAMLFGTILDNFLTWKVLICKATALTLGVGAGLPLGKEGPNCHMAACIAREMDTDFMKKRDKSIAGAQQVQKLLLAACSVGVGTSFSAPIGGVIFALELMLPQVFDSSMYWGCFVASVLGSLCYEVWRTWTANANFLIPLISTNILPGEGATTQYPLGRMFLDIGLGIITGFCGGMWVKLHSQLAGTLKRWRMRGAPTPVSDEERENYSFGEKVFAKLCCCFSCMWRDIIGIIIGVTINTVLAASLPLLNGKPQPLLLSTMFNKELMEDHSWILPGVGAAGTMILCALMKYFCTMMSLCLAIPGGIVAPTMIIGSLIGRSYILMIPQELQDMLISVPGQPITDEIRGAFMARFAIVGAAAFSTGVSRAFAMAITVFEVLALPNAVLPLCSATLTSIFVANKIALPFFDANLAARGLGGIPALTFTDHAMQPAFSIMKPLNPKSDCLNVISRLYDMHNLLRKSKDEFFAIVKPTENDPDQAMLVGSISRGALDALIGRLDPQAKNPEMVVDFTDTSLTTPSDGEPIVKGSPPHCGPQVSVKDVYLMMKVAHEGEVVYVSNQNCILGMITFNQLMTG